MLNYFLHRGHRKNRLLRGRLSDVLIRRMALVLDVLKNDFGDVDETMFLGFKRPFERIFCILHIERFL
jgi:hypothetical protein